ncbi:3-deoxy-D-manno-oct-2-ulosonic acid (Kdo) hydroxylase family protein [Ralstonia sp. A12]|uniref:Kdo hydroxylase family protein n=1 Tax=Ralstonia sp. A12 TaxID=1217052 RepID=UPI000575E22A|nr:Kdo hydroxylase family protein [Ralstonia sp. A12]KHK58887.1 3-deoxy-D-manno-oct-2-ulosonic acid (Kdo) hydroxylase family protein [Ralstonia sp. A12]
MGSMQGFAPAQQPVRGECVGELTTVAPSAIDMVVPWPVREWAPAVTVTEAIAMRAALERGNVLHFPALDFPLSTREQRFLDARWSDGKTKNINLRANETTVRGAVGAPVDLRDLSALIRRYADAAERLVLALFPDYGPHLKRAGASLRPAEIAGRPVSWRKDDTRLHVDAFPSNPLHGQRLLRVFHNIDPDAPRIWRMGEPFADFAKRFVPKTRAMLPGQSWLMRALRITKCPRSEYDHRMLQLHDLAKADLQYQRTAPQQTFEFAPGATWVVFSDQALHAAMRGRAMMEQTFYLDPAAIADRTHSPEAVLSRMLGKPQR